MRQNHKQLAYITPAEILLSSRCHPLGTTNYAHYLLFNKPHHTIAQFRPHPH